LKAIAVPNYRGRFIYPFGIIANFFRLPEIDVSGYREQEQDENKA
jgi:hypothetical protein